MGINLKELVENRPLKPNELMGKVVAIDAPNLMYPFYSMQLIGQSNVDEVMRENAVRTAYRGCIARVLDLAEQGARVCVFFDGWPPHPLKAETLEGRAKQRQKSGVPRLERGDYEGLARALAALGVPVWWAKHDAELDASALARMGVVDVVATTDYDALAMGATQVLRGLSSNAQKWTTVELRDTLDRMGVTREQFAAMVVLMGCDFASGVKGIGPKKALKLIKERADAVATIRTYTGDDNRERHLLAYQLILETPMAMVWTPAAARNELAPRRLDAEDALQALVRVGFVDTPDLRRRIMRLSLVQDGATQAVASTPGGESTS